MLRSLHIRNYVLIDSLDIEFPGGLVIITGQTGAGKSILLGALSLALGGKADPSAIPDTGENCVVEAVFEVPESLKTFFLQQDIEWEDGHLTVRRTLHPSGRSRCFANDSPVSVQVLQELSQSLIDIHSQHKSLMLKDKKWQLELLDNFAGCSAAVRECRRVWRELGAARNALLKARDALKTSSDEREYNRERYRRLADAAIREGELAQLEGEHLSLSHAEEILSNLEQISVLCEPVEGQSVISSLKEAGRILEKTAPYIPSMSDLAQRMESVRIELSDILEETLQASSSITVSRGRLEWVEERMALLYDLFNRYGCRSEAELLQQQERYAAAGACTEELEEEVARLEKKCADLQGRYSGICLQLHRSREAALGALSENILKSLRALEMDRAVFEVSMLPCDEGPEGTDEPLFAFSSSGTAPQDVAKCASGGEISRIMLSMKALMATYVNMPTLVFDEIDSGVSGSAAEAMGRMICRMGENMQVISITHLPQVAAKGNAHYVVTKTEDVSGTARSGISKVEGEDRVREIARLLSGQSVTPEAIANARSLMK